MPFYTLKNNNHRNKFLQNAFNKYGLENFKFVIIEENLEKTDLISAEQLYLDEFFGRERCYNNNPIAGNSLGRKLSENTKLKISQSHLGKKIPKEVKQRMSDAQMGIKNHFYGKQHTNATKNKIAISKKASSF